MYDNNKNCDDIITIFTSVNPIDMNDKFLQRFIYFIK